MSDEVVAAIRQDSAIRAGDPGRISALVEEKIVPNFDFRRITQIAMGVNWRRATPEQQEQLTREFVRSLIKQSGSEPIAIEYDLERTDSGWKVFDVRVAGMSLVATYRSSFTEEVRNRGVEGLINLLASKNRPAAT